jgi:Anti-sigma factor NepR
MPLGLGEWVMLMNRRECRESDKRDGRGPYGTRPRAEIDLKAVRAGIGTAIRTVHSDVLREEIPDGIAELLRQLDEPKDVGGG